MKVLFMGTPDFAVASLEMLLKEHEVIGVVTQPDRPKGRGKKMLFPVIKERAISCNIPVYQPEKVKNDEFIAFLETLDFDVIVVVAFGQILPEAILKMPKYGCINVHGSLLPKYRGAGPIQWAIINGDSQTGVTIMYMEKGLDSGDIIKKVAMDIYADDTYGSLSDRMSFLGADALKAVLADIEGGVIIREKQEHEKATYAPMIDKELGHINWADSSEKISCLIRGLTPQVGAFCFYDEEPLKLWSIDNYGQEFSGSQYGEIVKTVKNGFVVKTGDGSVLIKELQAKGGKRMSADAYMRGHLIETGKILL